MYKYPLQEFNIRGTKLSGVLLIASVIACDVLDSAIKELKYHIRNVFFEQW